MPDRYVVTEIEGWLVGRAPRRNHKLAARLWWLLLPFAGETGYACDEVPARWFAYPLTWLWKLVGKLPGSDPFEVTRANARRKTTESIQSRRPW